ncbi:adenylosuccinate synthase [Pendulispora albinea]|uniref:Adenylosuccinate synthetase n=1 Tax=Pendulispora albinea TaxID=2741071 RepID=A0ABZ2LMP5_9BACT
MSAVVVVGAQWGDEGKGKIVDIFTEHAEMVVRYAGGPNAGHTLVVGNDKVVVRLVPSGILRAHTRCVLAQGMAIDPTSLVNEIDELQRRGYVGEGQLVVSERAHAILPYHVAVDTLREQGADAIGTTKRGVGPCYEDKMARRGIPLGTFRDRARTEKLVRRALEAWQPSVAALGGTLPSLAEVMASVDAVRERIVPLLADTGEMIDEALRAGKNVLFEGAQGTLLDIDHGTYPYVTSSTASAGGASTGTGVGPTRLGKVIGLVKAYSTRVGGGPFPTELTDDVGERLRKAGAEFGSVTGRPRRTGWLDACAVRYSARINGLDGLALTKLDVLTGHSEIKVCTGYETPNGVSSSFPLEDADRARPVYQTLPGWKEDISGARTLADLPETARKYVEFVERETRCRVVLVSVGSRRDETILVDEVFG